MNPLKLMLMCLYLGCFYHTIASAQAIQRLDSGAQVSLRGLSVVSEQVFWCSGSKGTVVRSTNGGKLLQWIKVKGYEERDFRDIEAFDDQRAVIMAIGSPAIILITIDAGKSWQKVFEDTTIGMFLDAMDFDLRGHGVVIGDPLVGHLYRATSNDYGATWRPDTATEAMLDGESFFASSGTNIRWKRKPIWVSGGYLSRFYNGSRIIQLPMQRGRQSSGANSIAIHKNRAIVVGGDFSAPLSSDSNCLLIRLSKKLSWQAPDKKPIGYKSCVQHIHQRKWVCCGTSGVDRSDDDGKNWRQISNCAYHVMQAAPKSDLVYLAGPNGKIARMILPKK